jgi:hypothetical protein
MKMFFNVDKYVNKNNSKKTNTVKKNNYNMVQKKRNILPIFNIKSILNTKYATSCGSCG